MSELTEETACELVRALDNHSLAMQQLNWPDYSGAADTMYSASRRMEDAAGTMYTASRQ